MPLVRILNAGPIEAEDGKRMDVTSSKRLCSKFAYRHCRFLVATVFAFHSTTFYADTAIAAADICRAGFLSSGLSDGGSRGTGIRVVDSPAYSEKIFWVRQYETRGEGNAFIRSWFIQLSCVGNLEFRDEEAGEVSMRIFLAKPSCEIANENNDPIEALTRRSLSEGVPVANNNFTSAKVASFFQNAAKDCYDQSIISSEN